MVTSYHIEIFDVYCRCAKPGRPGWRFSILKSCTSGVMSSKRKKAEEGNEEQRGGTDPDGSGPGGNAVDAQIAVEALLPELGQFAGLVDIRACGLHQSLKIAVFRIFFIFLEGPESDRFRSVRWRRCRGVRLDQFGFRLAARHRHGVCRS